MQEARRVVGDHHTRRTKALEVSVVVVAVASFANTYNAPTATRAHQPQAYIAARTHDVQSRKFHSHSMRATNSIFFMKEHRPLVTKTTLEATFSAFLMLS